MESIKGHIQEVLEEMAEKCGDMLSTGFTLKTSLSEPDYLALMQIYDDLGDQIGYIGALLRLIKPNKCSDKQ